MWYDEEFYEEPTEFEEKMQEFKEEIARSVKKEFLEEMDRLRDENKKLQGIKEHFEQIKLDYQRKKQECDRIISQAEVRAKRTRLEELMKMFSLILWKPDYEYLYGSKCDKCDRRRQIKITLPSGKTVEDECDCAKRKKVMLPRIVVLYEITDRNVGLRAWYQACGKTGEKYYTLEHAFSIYANDNIVEPGTSFEELYKKEDKGKLLFRSKEECLAYCQHLNRKEGIPENFIYNCDGSVYKCDEENI